MDALVCLLVSLLVLFAFSLLCGPSDVFCFSELELLPGVGCLSVSTRVSHAYLVWWIRLDLRYVVGFFPVGDFSPHSKYPCARTLRFCTSPCDHRLELEKLRIFPHHCMAQLTV